LSCAGELSYVSEDTVVEQKYDYKLTSKYYYYKCLDCDRMFDEKITTTGIRHLSLANRDKAEKLAIQPLN
jgi:hypothetical protein